MAIAKLIDDPKPPVFLTLSWEEAQYIVALVGNVSGGVLLTGEQTKHRTMNDNIYMALDALGVEEPNEALFDYPFSMVNKNIEG